VGGGAPCSAGSRQSRQPAPFRQRARHRSLDTAYAATMTTLGGSIGLSGAVVSA
jgi:hypothetical protein